MHHVIRAFIVVVCLAGCGTQAEDAKSFEHEKQRSAYRELLPRAEKGHADSQHRLGRLYAKTRKYSQAAEWYRKAAEQGHAEAQWRLAGLYAGGIGVGQSDREAAAWIRKSAEQGNQDAMVALAHWHLTGKVVSVDYSEAIRLSREAAEGSDWLAQFVLGSAFYERNSSREDQVLAVKWLHLLEKFGGSLDSDGRYEKLLQAADADVVAEGKELAAEWIADKARLQR